jgi:hypothetical protein
VEKKIGLAGWVHYKLIQKLRIINNGTYEIKISQNICPHSYFDFNNPNFIAYEESDSR